jgi:hypothetical protein
MSEMIVLTEAELDMVSGGQVRNIAALVQAAHTTAAARGGNGGTAVAVGGTANANGGAATATATTNQTANGNTIVAAG